jgi:acid phosphatase
VFLRRFFQWGLPAALLGLAAALVSIWLIPGGQSTNRVVPRFDRVVLVVLENQPYDAVIGSSSAPEFNRLAGRYGLLTQDYAVAHPSLPNYLALVSGSTQGQGSEDCSCVVHAANLADTVEASGRSWRVYVEGFPSRRFLGNASGGYLKRHNPLLYFSDVVSSPRRLDYFRPLSDFRRDLERGTLPDLSLVVPDRCHSSHDCSFHQADDWLKQFLPPLLGDPALAGGVAFVTFDESDTGDTVGGGGRVPTLVLGPLVRSGARFSRRMTHYGLLRTIEDGWDLPRLGASRAAAPISGIWR